MTLLIERQHLDWYNKMLNKNTLSYWSSDTTFNDACLNIYTCKICFQQRPRSVLVQALYVLYMCDIWICVTAIGNNNFYNLPHDLFPTIYIIQN